MGLSDRDYMRRPSGGEAAEDYERGALKSEYGTARNQRRSRMRVMLVAIIVVVAIILMVVLGALR